MPENDFQLELIGTLEESESRKQLNQDIEKLKNKLDDLELTAALKDGQKAELEKQLSSLQAQVSDITVTTSALTELVNDINKALKGITISNVNVSSAGEKAGRQLGQLISDKANEAIKINKFDKKISSIKEAFVNTDKKFIDDDLEEDYKELISLSEKFNDSLPDEDKVSIYKQIDQLISSISNRLASVKTPSNIFENMDAGTYDKQLDDLIAKYRRLGLSSDEIAQKTEEVSTSLASLKNPEADISTLIQRENTFTEALKKSQNEASRLKNDLENIYNPKKQARLSNNIQNWLSKNTRASKEARESLEAYYRELSSGRVNSSRLDYIEQQLKDIDAAQRGLGKLGKNLKDQLSEAGESFTQWISISSAIMTFVYQLQKIPQKVKEVDDAVTDFTMATNANKTQIESLIDTYADLGDELSATVTDVTISATEWIKQGKSIAESETLIADAMILSKVGKLSSADATKYLTSVMKSYQVSVDDTLSVVDKLSAVDMASATDVGGLAEGISTVANNARLAGVSMDKLLGYLAAVGEVSQEGMSSVGTAYNAIFARMGNIKLSRLTDYETGEDLSNVETVLKGVGISLRDSQNTFRDFDEVLDETANRWASFSEVQQRAIANAFSGTHHVDSFITLMENYDNALKYSEISMTSSGQAMEKFSAYQDSLTAHIEQLENAFIQMSNNVLDSDFLKILIDIGTVGVKAIDGLVSSIGTLGTIGLGAGLFAGFKNIGKTRMSVRASILF